MSALELSAVMVARGYNVTPCEGKRPLLRDWTTADANDAGYWVGRPPSTNVGVVTGPLRAVRVNTLSLVVFDADTGGAINWFETVYAMYGGAQQLVRLKTPHGAHFPFTARRELELGCRVGVQSGLDVRCRGGLAIAYTDWPDVCDLPFLSDWLLSAVLLATSPPNAERRAQIRPESGDYALNLAVWKVRLAAEGGRNARLYREAVSLFERTDVRGVARSLRQAALAAGLGIEEIEETLASAALKAEQNRSRDV